MASSSLPDPASARARALGDASQLLAGGVRRYDAPQVAAIRSRCKSVFSALGGLGDAQELYSRYWQYRYEKRHGGAD